MLDYREFASTPVTASESPRPLPTVENTAFKLPKTITVADDEKGFDEFLSGSGTVAWIVLQNGQLVDERYYDGYSRSSTVPSFSVAKSLVGALVAIAHGRREIQDLDEAITVRLPKLAQADRGWGKVTWQHLLDMRSGVNFKEDYADLNSDIAKMYLGDDIASLSLSLRLSGKPDKQFAYNSANTQLLAMALEQATGKNIADQLEERLWQPFGAEFDATWSTDRAKPASLKAFCCLNARAIDFARFGQLILDHGRVGSREVIPSSWIDRLLTKANNGKSYADQWWLLRDTNERGASGALLAEGILGQFVFVDPQSRVVIVRMGHREDSLPWRTIFKAIANANPIPTTP